MSNSVQFDEPGMQYNQGPHGPRRSALTNLVITLGLAKDDKQAAIVLIVVGIVAVAIAFVFWPRGGEVLPPPPQPVSFMQY